MTADEIRALISEEIKRIKIVAGYPRNDWGNPHKVIDVRLVYDDEEISKTEIQIPDSNDRNVF